MTIPKDEKDWTWVLAEACDECGFDPARADRRDAARRVRQIAGPFERRLAADDAAVRPRPEVWAPVEYGAHVRDVARIMDHRLELILAAENPQFANWDQDQSAIDEDYLHQDPELVADQLHAALAEFADAISDVPESAWNRPGHRSNGSVFTAETLVIYALHDLEHHVWDVTGAPVGAV